METTSAGWTAHPAMGIARSFFAADAAELGGAGDRDEVLVVGEALAEAISTADYAYTDLRELAPRETRDVAIADFDGDGSLDALTAGASAIELCVGDGTGTLALADTLAVDLGAVHVAAITGSSGPARAVAVVPDGLHIVEVDGRTLAAGSILPISIPVVDVVIGDGSLALAVLVLSGYPARVRREHHATNARHRPARR